MKKFNIIKMAVVFFGLSFILTGCGNSENNNSNNYNSVTTDNTTSASRLSVSKKIEEELSFFSTKILIKESERQNNINITCSSLNETIVKSGEEFSFCNTVGKATPDKGYEKADIFDSDGDIISGYGGGNCQISSTLYNAVLATSGLTVTERSPHSRKVDYVEVGKDAAVAYGSVDFKFRNDNPYDIKIYASCTENDVSIRLVKI